MLKNFKSVSLSYKNSPIEVRELFALSENSGKRFLNKFREITGITEALVVSTCNRTEVYYASETDFSEDIIKLLGIEKGINAPAQYIQYFERITDNDDAINHLFNVSIGLESQVVGDLQIINQVKTAYQWSADENMAGPFLHRLMHTIFFTNKRVVQETPFRDGAASMSYAAVELIQDLTENVLHPKILVIGTGEIGLDAIKNLSESDLKNITITNRTEDTAKNIATEYGFRFTPFDQLRNEIKNSDVIISSISVDKPLITKEWLETEEILSYKYFIDLSVPRSIETDVESVPGAIVYNIDHIKDKANEALEKRTAAIPQVESIIEASIAEFNDWAKDMEVSPTINKLKNALEDIRQQEIGRFLKELSDSEKHVVEEITKSMMQKIIKLPVLNLKAACKRGEAETLIDVLNDLFDLEKQPEQKAK